MPSDAPGLPGCHPDGLHRPDAIHCAETTDTEHCRVATRTLMFILFDSPYLRTLCICPWLVSGVPRAVHLPSSHIHFELSKPAISCISCLHAHVLESQHCAVLELSMRAWPGWIRGYQTGHPYGPHGPDAIRRATSARMPSIARIPWILIIAEWPSEPLSSSIRMAEWVDPPLSPPNPRASTSGLWLSDRQQCMS
jgi:hypothetical protein